MCPPTPTISIPRPHICSIPFPLSKIKNPLFAAVSIRSVIRHAPPLCHLPLSSFLPRRRRSLILLSETLISHPHLENQAELLRDARKSMLHELERLQVEEEMLMRKFYEFMTASVPLITSSSRPSSIEFHYIHKDNGIDDWVRRRREEKQGGGEGLDSGDGKMRSVVPDEGAIARGNDLWRWR
ncbi:hypothetical protein Droror1_Dr00003253 [Drosera rotundifolia]